MKKTIVWFGAALLAVGIAACGGGSKKEATTPPPATMDADAGAAAPAPTPTSMVGNPCAEGGEKTATGNPCSSPK